MLSTLPNQDLDSPSSAYFACVRAIYKFQALVMHLVVNLKVNASYISRRQRLNTQITLVLVDKQHPKLVCESSYPKLVVIYRKFQIGCSTQPSTPPERKEFIINMLAWSSTNHTRIILPTIDKAIQH